MLIYGKNNSSFLLLLCVRPCFVTHFIFTKLLRGKYCFYQFTNEETVAIGSSFASSHTGGQVEKLESKPRGLDQESIVLITTILSRKWMVLSVPIMNLPQLTLMLYFSYFQKFVNISRVTKTISVPVSWRYATFSFIDISKLLFKVE